MQIKRFEARNMAEAFRMIKAEFGPDAVILSARHVRKDTGLFGVTRTVGVEVTAAIDAPYSSSGQSSGRRPAAATTAQTVAQASGQVSNGFRKNLGYRSGVQADKSAGVVSRISKRGQQLSQEQGQFWKERKRAEAPPPSPEPFEPIHAMLDDAVVDEPPGKMDFPDARESLAPAPSTRDGETRLVQVLEAHGVERSLGAELWQEIRRLQTTWPRLAKAAMADLLLKVIEARGFSEEMLREPLDGKVHLFTGPAGAGKSSVLSKLAARSVVDEEKRVAIVTLDDSRMGAVYQLKVFARMLNMPVILAQGPGPFTNALEKLRDMDRIFVDTPGVGGKDLDRLKHIHACLAASPPDRVHLVLSAVPSGTDLDQQTRRFLPLRPDDFIFTRFDETSRWGGAFSQLVRYRLPIAYVTAGQEIPEDIGRVNLRELVARVLSPPMERPAMQLETDTMSHGVPDRRYGFS